MGMMHRGAGAWQHKERRMKRGLLSVFAVGGLMSAASVYGQTTTTETTTVADNSPTENLVTASARGPRVTVNAARARHLALRNNRLAYQHGTADGSEVSNSTDSGTSTDSTTDGLSDALSGLINSGGLGSLAGLLGGDFDLNSLLGGTSGTTGGTNTNIPSNLPPEVLQMLQGAGININDVFPPDDSAGTSKTSQRSQSSGSILQDRWPGKTEAVSQTADDTEEQSFVDRWKEQMALTFFRNLFTGITAGLSSQQFIGNIEDALRPILRPDSITDAE
jgi:hypothetical protein